MGESLVIGAVLAAVGVLGVLAGFRMEREYERGVIFRLGRFHSVRGPGLYWVIPVVDQKVRVDIRTLTGDIESQETVGWHVLTNGKGVVGARRYRFLTTERTRTWFAEALWQKRHQWPIDVWAYVIMPEHVHLLLATPFPLVRACHPTAAVVRVRKAQEDAGKLGRFGKWSGFP